MKILQTTMALLLAVGLMLPSAKAAPIYADLAADFVAGHDFSGGNIAGSTTGEWNYSQLDSSGPAVANLVWNAGASEYHGDQSGFGTFFPQVGANDIFTDGAGGRNAAANNGPFPASGWISAHPGSTNGGEPTDDDVVLSFIATEAMGSVAVEYELNQPYFGGDGIDWSLNKIVGGSPTTLASGTGLDGAGTGPLVAGAGSLAAGDVIALVISVGAAGDEAFDATDVRMTIIPEPATLVLLGIASLGWIGARRRF